MPCRHVAGNTCLTHGTQTYALRPGPAQARRERACDAMPRAMHAESKLSGDCKFSKYFYFSLFRIVRCAAHRTLWLPRSYNI